MHPFLRTVEEDECKGRNGTQENKFLLITPALSKGVQLIGMMLGHAPWLKYDDHDFNDHAKFPDFTPDKYLTMVHYP